LPQQDFLVRLKLFDRSGYKNKITLEGEIVLSYCRSLLEIRRQLEEKCKKIREGWEPSLKLIYDEVVDFNFIADAIAKLNQINSLTEIRVFSAHLSEVETLFNQENADVMVTVLPLQQLQIPSKKLHPIHMKLVAHRGHRLFKKTTERIPVTELNRHTFISIKTTPGFLGLSTEKMIFDSYFYVKGFIAKKVAIMKKLGFGWLPDYLIDAEIKSGVLRAIESEIDTTHTLYPRLYHRSQTYMGKTLESFLKHYESIAPSKGVLSAKRRSESIQSIGL
jgi:DNA-binding transcriptional LysR family regulator